MNKLNPQTFPAPPTSEALLESEQAFRSTLLETLRVGVCRIDMKGCIQSLNLEGARILGRTEQSCLGLSLHGLIQCLGEDPHSKEAGCPLDHVLKTKKSVWIAKTLIKRRTGETRWIEYHCTPLPCSINPGALFLFRDLEPQLQLLEDHEHLASMPEENPNPIVELDTDADLIYANSSMIRLLDTFGFHKSGIPKILPQNISRIAKDCLDSMNEVRDLTVRVDGAHYEWTFAPIQEKGYIRGYGLDITKHSRATDAMMQFQSRFVSLVDSIQEGIVLTDLNGIITSSNPAAQAIFGYQSEEMIGQPFTRLLDFAHREIYRQGIEQVSFREDDHAMEPMIEVSGLRKDGQVFPLEVSLTSWKVGIETQFGCILRDITARKQKEQDLRIENKRLTQTLDCLTEALVTTDVKGHISFLNPMAEAIMGWSQSEANNRPLREIFRILETSTGGKEEAASRTTMQLNSLNERDSPKTILAKDGTQRTIVLREGPIRDHQGQLIGSVLVFHDVSDRNREEAERQRISKLNSLGVLAGGIAHDFNNLLTTILGNLFMAKLKMVSQDPVTQGLQEAEKACLRAKDLTQQLLTFAKGGAPIKKRMAIQDMVRLNTIFALSGSATECTFHLSDTLWPVNVDEAQLKQVIHNLVINARQAMPRGGMLTIQGENVMVDPQTQPQVSSLPKGPYLALSFQDQGHGIDPKHLPNIYDPYFSTKPGAHGLGLATVHSIIRRHGGHITVTSTSDAGTTFTVFLPALPPSTPDSEEDIPLPSTSSQEPILVMEDESDLRHILKEMLVRFGYNVTTVQEGNEALDAYHQAKQQGHPFAAVILDLTVPNGMGGQETIQHLRAMDAQVKAIVTSGYSDDQVLVNYRDYGFDAFLPKPYQMTDLHRVLQNVLAPSSL